MNEQAFEMTGTTTIIIKLEYVWLDGHETKNLRSKVRYEEWTMDSSSGNLSREEVLDKIPDWSFDGSSTKQSDTSNSDIILKPVKVYHNPLEISEELPSFLILCETYDNNGLPHKTNTRNKLEKIYDEDMWFSVEQEYTLMDTKTNKPSTWSDRETINEQGEYYCGLGNNVTDRIIVEQHALACIECNIPFFGTNAEVLLSQWEYQLKPETALNAADDLWMSRYLLQRLCENYGVYASFHPKPVNGRPHGQWNGAGAHINFSTEYMRENSDKQYIENLCEAFGDTHEKHIKVYGKDNEKRLTGDCETQHISKFSYGVGDRGASIRIPSQTAQEWKGYLEDRRPAANVDPYEAFSAIINTLSKISEPVGV